jgi:hypothetical protein
MGRTGPPIKAAMKNHKPQQLDLFADGARAFAAGKRPPQPRPTEADLQSRLDAARMRLRELVVFGMRTWLPAATLHRLQDAEQWRRREVRLHFRMLERFREEQRRRGPERSAVDEAGSPR